ncbi:MAG: hypothetical protein KDA51_19475, partial [Planctomycetales bacterium]|nr:hypothetical protein [Planctomycetales bacterium]
MTLTSLSVQADSHEVEVAAKPDQVLLQESGSAVSELSIEVHEVPDATATEIVLRSTAGTVEAVEAIAPGRFRAHLIAPTTIFPQFVVVLAADVSPIVADTPPRVGYALVSYDAAIELKGSTEAGARMSMQLGKRRFGPVRVGADGLFKIPLVVQPGENWGIAVSSDSLGNRSRSRINLFLPEVQRLHTFMIPKQLVANGQDTGWLYAISVSRFGDPQDTRLKVSAKRGRLGPAVRLGKGLVRFAYTAPQGVGDQGKDVVRLHSAATATKVQQDIALVAGKPTTLSVDVRPDLVPADGKTSAELMIKSLDAY